MAEMGAGAIVGIVIAVLLVVLIIFIVVFARATGRWCFAGRFIITKVSCCNMLGKLNSLTVPCKLFGQVNSASVLVLDFNICLSSTMC